MRIISLYVIEIYHARFTCSLYFHQVDQPKGVLPRQMYINNTGQYDKYFNAYKDLTIGLAKLFIRENNGNVSANDSYLNLAFENMLKLETKIAKVVLVLLAFNHNSEQANYNDKRMVPIHGAIKPGCRMGEILRSPMAPPWGFRTRTVFINNCNEYDCPPPPATTAKILFL